MALVEPPRRKVVRSRHQRPPRAQYDARAGGDGGDRRLRGGEAAADDEEARGADGAAGEPRRHRRDRLAIPEELLGVRHAPVPTCGRSGAGTLRSLAGPVARTTASATIHPGAPVAPST